MSDNGEVPPAARNAIDQLVSSIEEHLSGLAKSYPTMDSGAFRLLLGLEFLRLLSQHWLPQPLDQTSAESEYAFPRGRPRGHRTRPDRVARTRRMVQGSQRQETFGPIEMAPDTCEAYFHGCPLELSPSQFKVLLLLVRSQGHVVRYETLAQEVWRVGIADARKRLLLKMHVRNLRLKLEESAGRPAPIQSVRGFGYRIRPEAGPANYPRESPHIEPAHSNTEEDTRDTATSRLRQAAENPRPGVSWKARQEDS